MSDNDSRIKELERVILEQDASIERLKHDVEIARDACIDAQEKVLNCLQREAKLLESMEKILDKLEDSGFGED